MLSVVRECFDVELEAEISMECNPGTVNEQNLKKYRAAGINRLSIGLQSTQDSLLKKLGSIHTFQQFLETYQVARATGFSNINIDLMSALPGQTLSDYEETLYKVLALKPEHISAYSLIVEEGTPFYDMDLDLPDEDTERLMYERTEAILQEQGYERYEISNYALPGRECRHNQVYWERGEYLGVGLGASSLLRKMQDKELPYAAEIRTKNNSDLNSYLQSDFSDEEEIVLTRREAMEEFFFLGLRQMKGVSLVQFAEEFGEDTIEWFDEAIGQSLREGLLIQEGGRLYLSKKGIDVSNIVFARFLE
jgi:oxygen-independent coproporphyrinogen-3 oxidase